MLNGIALRKSLDIRDWEMAQQKIREWEAEGAPVTEPEEVVTIEQARAAFLNDAEARGLRESSLKKYRRLFNQMSEFAAAEGALFLMQWEDIKRVRRFRESWADKNYSAKKKLERLRTVFRFFEDSGWISDNPAKKLKSPIVNGPPTLPFTREEVTAMLAACDVYPDAYGNPEGARLKALVLFLRFSGMRIGDGVTCAVERLTGPRLFLYTAKTGVPVTVKLPPFVVDVLQACARTSERFWFWTGQGTPDTVAGNWRRSLRKLFKLAGIKGGHPHRFRDTFAVELLISGVPLERVSVLLGHSSIRVTEKHYAPWILARQEQLEQDVERSWERDPVVLAGTKGTPDVHGNRDAVN